MKTTQLMTFSLSPEVCTALAQIAARGERSRSWLANRLLREGVAARLAMELASADEQAPK
jgi:predicted transcriptional regulator